MKVAVYDTYVTRKEGGTMHFDILVPESAEYEHVLKSGRAYLKTKHQEGQPLSPKECKFCHIEHATPEVAQAIQEQGFCIIEMEGVA